MAESLTSGLLSTVSANNALSPLFGTQSTFANPLALAQNAQAVQAYHNEFPTQQVLALSGLYTQITALNSAASQLAPSLQANALLVAEDSPVLLSSLYTETTASSSNTAAVTATSKNGATMTSYNVGVSQLGVQQVNTGSTFVSSTANNAAGGVGLAAGSGQLQVTMTGAVSGSVTAVANYNITSAANTNQTVLTTIANAINSITSNNDLQAITLNGASSGNFTLTFNGQTTGNISASGSPSTVASNIQTALGALSGVGAANVSVAATSNGTYLVGFKGALAGRPLPLIQATNASLNSGASDITVSQVGPQATVENSSGNSTLSITASDPGTANAFTLADVTGTGITATGANTVSTTAQDAIYTLNGATYRATAANSTTIDNGNVTLSFSSTTSSDATVTIASDNSDLTTAVTNLATAYNNLQSYLSSNSQFLTSGLSQAAENIITSQAGNLAAIGITGNTSLSIDQTTLGDANTNVVEAIFGGVQGIANRFAMLSQTVLNGLAGTQAASPASPQDSSQAATGLAALYTPELLTSGGNLSIKA
ncbi:MAG TPA: flagellar filament capping protein FliD [Chloroflexota bacterium]|nr:flagellar filament capping protein FliD [Chloroflexota bacterium]